MHVKSSVRYICIAKASVSIEIKFLKSKAKLIVSNISHSNIQSVTLFYM